MRFLNIVVCEAVFPAFILHVRLLNSEAESRGEGCVQVVLSVDTPSLLCQEDHLIKGYEAVYDEPVEGGPMFKWQPDDML